MAEFTQLVKLAKTGTLPDNLRATFKIRFNKKRLVKNANWLMLAVWPKWGSYHPKGKKVIKVLKALFDAGLSGEARDSRGNTLLTHIVYHRPSSEVLDWYIREYNPEVNVQNNYQSSPLMYAVHKGRADHMRSLLDAGADPNLVDRQGRTALMHSCFCGYIWAVEILLEKGARTDIQDPNGETAIFSAVLGKTPAMTKVLECLYQAGADFDATNTEGNTIFDIGGAKVQEFQGRPPPYADIRISTAPTKSRKRKRTSSPSEEEPKKSKNPFTKQRAPRKGSAPMDERRYLTIESYTQSDGTGADAGSGSTGASSSSALPPASEASWASGASEESQGDISSSFGTEFSITETQ